MVESAIDYKYSSSRHHVGLLKDKLIKNYDVGVRQDEYLKYLTSMLRHKSIELLQTYTRKGLPCGDDDFITKLSDKIGRDLSFKGVGRPKKG